jgi:hypothetical protein
VVDRKKCCCHYAWNPEPEENESKRELDSAPVLATVLSRALGATEGEEEVVAHDRHPAEHGDAKEVEQIADDLSSYKRPGQNFETETWTSVEFTTHTAGSITSLI